MAESFLVAGAREIFNKLISLATQEIGSGWEVKGELEKLKVTLTTIQAVLHDAEKQQVEKETVRHWLWRLKSVAFDADDLLDEFAYEALQSRIKGKVRNFFSQSNPILFGFKMAHKIKEINKKLDEIGKDGNIFHLRVGSVDTSPNNEDNRETHSYIDDSEVVGREADKSKIIDMLISSNSQQLISVIPIVGMGGLGKTTLAQLVYNDEWVVSHFDIRMWVYVSDDFNVKRLTRQITELATGKNDTSNMEIMLHTLHEKLKGCRFLLVLDDVWNKDTQKWEQLKDSLKVCGVGSTVLVTTCSSEVAEIMAPRYTHHLGRLSEDDCWSLFKPRAFWDGGAEETPDLIAIGMKIMEKGRGMPLAAKVLGNLMHSKKEENEWVAIENSEIWNLPEDENGILPALKLSYDHLPSQTKQCFAYCSIFPKGHIFNKETLIQLWMAEGFLQPRGYLTMEDIGNNHLNTLSWNFLFQNISNYEYGGDEGLYKMHHLVHDLARHVAGIEYSIMEASKMKDVCGLRGLSLVMGEDISAIPKELNKAKKLRTFLLLCSRWNKSFKVSDNMWLNFRSSRALDLASSGIQKLPSSIRKLIHLRYLDLSGTEIEVLPESITRLYNLETLKLSDCNFLKELPKEMREMISLKHLVFDNFVRWEQMPPDMRRLTRLQTLSMYIVGRARRCSIKELTSLNLRGRLRISHLENTKQKEAECVNLNKQQDIHSLEFSWDGRSPSDARGTLEVLQPHQNLRFLKIFRFGGQQFPKWLTDGSLLPNLVNVYLVDCNTCRFVWMLGELPLLKVLELSHLKNVDSLLSGAKYLSPSSCTSTETTREPAFPSLKRLILDDMPELMVWEEVYLSFPCLEDLRIFGCINLHDTPSHFPSLKELHFRNSRNEALNKVTRNLTSLTRLVIEECSDVDSLPIGLLQRNRNVLQFIEIDNCPFLLTIILTELEVGLPLVLPSLVSLKITSCLVLRSLPELWAWTSLKKLSLLHLESLKSLPGGFQCLTMVETSEIGPFSMELNYFPGADDLQHLVSINLRLA